MLISTCRTPSPVRHLTAEDLLSTDEAAHASGLPLESISVEGLLSFAGNVSLQFGRLNVLVGPNGSGKSNLLDCIRVLQNTPLNIQQVFKDSGFEDWLNKNLDSQKGSGLLKAVVNVPNLGHSLLHEIKLSQGSHSQALLEELIQDTDSLEGRSDPYFIGSARGQAIMRFLDARKRERRRELDAREYNPQQSILSQIRDAGQYPEITRLAYLYRDFRIYSEWSFGRNSNLREATQAGRTDNRLSESMNDLALVLNALEQTDAHERIRELLRELKETYKDYVTRILFGRVGLEILEEPFKMPVPAKRLSDGTLRFLALAAILLQSQPPPLICLEEPELGMHPDMIRMVAEMIVTAAGKTQIILTTHSVHLLTALQYDFDTLFAFGSDSVGSTVRQFSQDEYKQWSEEHVLGELWTSGELGGNRW